MHCIAFLAVITVAVVESSHFNCTNCGTVKCGENEVFVGDNAGQDEFCKPLYTPLSELKRPRQCVCKHDFVRNSWGECVPKENCLRCKSRQQKDWHLCSSSCPITGNKAIRFFCRTMCTPGCDCPPGWVVDPGNWKKCIMAETTPPLCQPHSRFQPCVSTCEPVCGIRPPKRCFTHCHRGACVCNKGFAALVRNGVLTCVRQEKCEWYLRTAQVFALNRTVIAGEENAASNIGGGISGPGGVVLPEAIRRATSNEGTYSFGIAPNYNVAAGAQGTPIRTATTFSGNAIGLGSTGTGTGAARILSSGAAASGGIGTGLGSTLLSVSTRPGMSGIRASGAPLVVSLGPGMAVGSVSAGSALSSISTGSIVNNGGMTSTGVRTGVNTEAGTVGTSMGAAATSSLLHPLAPRLNTIGSPVPNVTVTGSSTAGMGTAGTYPNVHVDGAIAVNSGSVTSAIVLPSFPVVGLGEITAGFARAPASVSTGSGLSNTVAAGAHQGLDVGSVVHGMTSTNGGAAGLLSNAGVRHDAVTVTTGATVPGSLSHGGNSVGAVSAPTMMPSAPRGSIAVLSGSSGTPSLSAGVVDAGGETAGGGFNVSIGPGTVNVGSRGADAISLLSSAPTEGGRIGAGPVGTHRLTSSESYRRAALSALPDGIYTSEHGTAIIPSSPVGSPGVRIGSGTAVPPTYVRAVPSEVGTGLSAGGPLYVGRTADTTGITVRNGRLPVAGVPSTHALGTISARVNVTNVPMSTSGAPVSTYGTGSLGYDGAVSAPAIITASPYSPGSNLVITTESSGASSTGTTASSFPPRGYGTVGGATTHSADALSGITEAGGNHGFNGADGRYTSASSGYHWMNTNTLGGRLNGNREYISSSAANKPPALTFTNTAANGIGGVLAPSSATNTPGTTSFGGTHGTASIRTAYTSATTGISGTGVGIEAANNGLSGMFTHLGSRGESPRGGAVFSPTAATTGENLGVHVTGLVPTGTVGTILTAIGAQREGPGAAEATGNVVRHRLEIANSDGSTDGKTLFQFYPFVLSAVPRSGAAESSHGLVTSDSALTSSLPHASVLSPNMDIGENHPSTASATGGPNIAVSGTMPLANK